MANKLVDRGTISEGIDSHEVIRNTKSRQVVDIRIIDIIHDGTMPHSLQNVANKDKEFSTVDGAQRFPLASSARLGVKELEINGDVGPIGIGQEEDENVCIVRSSAEVK